MAVDILCNGKASLPLISRNADSEESLQVHGLIVADNGSDMYITGTYDTRWNNDVLNPAFAGLTASDFEVIQLGLQPAPADRDSGPADLHRHAGSHGHADADTDRDAGGHGDPDAHAHADDHADAVQHADRQADENAATEDAHSNPDANPGRLRRNRSRRGLRTMASGLQESFFGGPP